MRALMSLIAVACFASPALAQSEPAPPAESRVRYKAVTEIDGEDLRVGGELSTPNGAVVSLRRAGSFKPLLQLRQNFDAEVKDSVDRIR